MQAWDQEKFLFLASCWHLEQYTCHPETGCDCERVQKWLQKTTEQQWWEPTRWMEWDRESCADHNYGRTFPQVSSKYLGPNTVGVDTCTARAVWSQVCRAAPTPGSSPHPPRSRSIRPVPTNTDHHFSARKAVFRIRDILVRFRILGSVHFDPALDPALFVSDLQDSKKRVFF